MMEDYVHEEGNKFAAVALLTILPAAATEFGVICVLRIALSTTTGGTA